MNANTIPEPWATWLLDAGFVDPRGASNRPSMRRLAEAANLSNSTIANTLHGRTTPSAEVLSAISDALRVPLREVHAAAGVAATDARRPYEWPAEADQLTTRQRSAVTELIRAMVAGNERPGAGA